jgi:imidazolonepropionase-like amidohydrolase
MKSLLTAIITLSAAAACLSGVPVLAADDDVHAIVAARIYMAPDRAPIDDGVVLIRHGKIVDVGPRSDVQIPRTAQRYPQCDGGVLTSGFQNSHVHFMEPAFNDAAKQPADALAAQFSRMLVRYGFTTVVDTGSMLDNTLALRARVERGDVAGPRILTAGAPLYPENGIPIYLRDLPPDFLAQLRQPASADAAVAIVRANIERGADATKLFAATPQGNRRIAYMSLAIARAAVDETHAHGKLVIAHPTDNQGIQLAIAAGVDVIAHTTFEGGPSTWPPEQTAALVAHHMSLVPTLKLWPYELHKMQLPADFVERALDDAVEQVRGFAAGGGQVLFGTDVGYMTDYDPTDEYTYLARALTPLQILAALTTSPAARWKESERRGSIDAGKDADLVILAADPAQDARRFAGVRCTIREGRLIFAGAPTLP